MYFGVVISLVDLDCSKTDGFRFTNNVNFTSHMVLSSNTTNEIKSDVSQFTFLIKCLDTWKYIPWGLTSSLNHYVTILKICKTSLSENSAIFNFGVIRSYFVMWLFIVNRNLTALNGYMIGLICPDCQNSRLFSIKVQQYYAWIDPVHISHTRQKSLMTAGWPLSQKGINCLFFMARKGCCYVETILPK